MTIKWMQKDENHYLMKFLNLSNAIVELQYSASHPLLDFLSLSFAEGEQEVTEQN